MNIFLKSGNLLSNTSWSVAILMEGKGIIWIFRMYRRSSIDFVNDEAIGPLVGS